MTAMKWALPIILVIVALVATTGCLDDLSSHGYCSGTKTSVIITDHTYAGNFMASGYAVYVVDASGCRYAWEDNKDRNAFDQYSGHNVTFTYHSKDGHYRIDEVIKDYDAVCSCDCGCNSCCVCATPTSAPTPIPCHTQSCNCGCSP